MDRSGLDDWLDRQRTDAEDQRRWRRWLLDLEWCRCWRPIADRWYLGHLLCRRCNRWRRAR